MEVDKSSPVPKLNNKANNKPAKTEDRLKTLIERSKSDVDMKGFITTKEASLL